MIAEANAPTNPTRIKEKAAVVATLQAGGTFEMAAQAASIDRSTVWQWRQDDPQFMADCERALNSRIRIVEDALYAKAVGGNTTAAIFWLCNRVPERWRHVQNIQLEHSGGVDIKHTLTDLVASSRNGGFARGSRLSEISEGTSN